MPIVQTITDEQIFTMRIQPKTPAGKPAPVDGVPTWEVTSGDAANLVVAEGGMSAIFTSTEDPSFTMGFVRADAKMGDGVVEIFDTFEITVVDADASALHLEGAISDKPPVT